MIFNDYFSVLIDKICHEPSYVEHIVLVKSGSFGLAAAILDQLPIWNLNTVRKFTEMECQSPRLPRDLHAVPTHLGGLT